MRALLAVPVDELVVDEEARLLGELSDRDATGLEGHLLLLVGRFAEMGLRGATSRK